MFTFSVRTEKITAFDTKDVYIFKTCFNENQIFNQLEVYDIGDNYQFKTLRGGVERVRQIFDEKYYGLTVVDNVKDYCVAVYGK